LELQVESYDIHLGTTHSHQEENQRLGRSGSQLSRLQQLSDNSTSPDLSNPLFHQDTCSSALFLGLAGDYRHSCSSCQEILGDREATGVAAAVALADNTAYSAATATEE